MGDKEDVRNHLDIVDLIGQYVVLKSAGRNFKGLCPFHKEKSPSFMVSSERQTFKCFGCSKGGDIFSFYMEMEGVTFPEALKDLAEKAGVTLTNFQPTEDYSQKEKLLEINRLSAQFYHYLLTEHKLGKKALEYLQERGVTASQIKDFQMGYAPDSWEALTKYLIRKKKLNGEDVEQVGLAVKGNQGWYDRFRGRVMFPLQDTRGNIVGFSGRVLPWTEDNKSGKYINTPETQLYHKSQMLYPLYQIKDTIREKNAVVVVEGEFDVLASLRASVRNVVAVKGSALTEDQVKILHRYCSTIILALDSDNAGIAAAKRAIVVAQAQDVNVKVVELSEGKDPDELVKTQPKKWREAVKAAVGVFDFFLDIARRQYDVTTMEGKQAITKEIIPLLNQLQNKVIQAHYAKKTAELLGVEATVVDQEMDRQSRQNQIGRAPVLQVEEKHDDQPRLHSMLEELLTMVVHYYPALNVAAIPLEDFPQMAVTKILEKIKTDAPQDVVVYAKTLPPELQGQFDDSFLREPEALSDKELESRFQNLIAQVAKLTLRGKLTQLRATLPKVSDGEREALEHQINDVLVRFRKYG